MSNFPCTSCGLCCRHISGLKELQAFDRGDGVCQFLKDNQCSIYETRPLICRIDEMYELDYKHLEKNEFYQLNIKACLHLQKSAGIPIEKQITLYEKGSI
jgi:uncharacterized protein